MRYLVLLAASDEAMPVPGTPEFDQDMAGFAAFSELAGDAIVAGEALEDRSTCTTIRHTGGEVTITDGPFAEAVEGLGGMFVLEAADLDEAIELARNIPSVHYGALELRPMVEWSAPTGDGDRPAPRWFVTIHGPETPAETPGSPGWDEGAAEHGRFAEAAGDALLGAGAVHPTSTATTLRLCDGELSVTDGPYAEGVEVVGGFYVLGGPPDRVVDVASRIPVPEGGGVQIQAVMEIDG